MTAVLYYTDHHVLPLPPGHRFPIEKYRLTRELLEQDGRYQFRPAPLAEAAALKLAHDPEYIRQFCSGDLPAQAMRRIGFPWSTALVERTLASVGATLAATHDAMSSGFGGTLAGGTHHAFRAEGSGFCVFNDIAVGVNWAREYHEVGRAAVVDLDVHQGDGTAKIFEDDSGVLTISVHGRNNFPFRKQRSCIDLELPDGTADEEYICALHPLLNRVREFSPDILFYQSGVDALACDRLGRLALSHEGLQRRDRLILDFCHGAHIPVVVTLGGGYGQPIARSAEAHANTYRVAAEVLQC